MKKLILTALILLIACPVGTVLAFPRTPAVERFTNASCGPCATLNAAWYNQTVDGLETQGYLNHIVYNVNWPGPNDPMYLVNAADNMIRRGLYAVDSVPWIEVDGVTFVRTNNTEIDRTNFTNARDARSAGHHALSGHADAAGRRGGERRDLRCSSRDER